MKITILNNNETRDWNFNKFKFLNGLEVPEKSVKETIKILEEKNLGKNKLIID